jgi:hypothetical protein
METGLERRREGLGRWNFRTAWGLIVGSDQDPFGLVFAQREVIAAHLDFDRVAQRCEADQFDLGADEQAHFHEARAAFGRKLDFRNGSGGAEGNRGKRLRVNGHSERPSRGRDRLDHDRIGQFFADAQAGVANLANETGLARDQFDVLFLAEAQFAQAGLEFGPSRKMFDTNHGTGLDAAQRADACSGTLAFENNVWLYRF